MSEHIAGNPDMLETYTQDTLTTIGPLRHLIDDYSFALRAFLDPRSSWAGIPLLPGNNFGDAGVVDHGPRMHQLVDDLADLDAKPAAFAFALRELDQRPWPEDRSGRSWTVDIGMFEALVEARLDLRWQGKSDANVRSYVQREAGSAAAKQMAKDGGSVDQALVEQLRKSANDPDFVRGFFDILGPQGLADLSEKLNDRFPEDPRDASKVHDADDALSLGLGTYSRVVPLNKEWLNQFAVQTPPDGEREYRLAVLAPLLTSGSFDKEFLKDVGDRMLHPTGLYDNQDAEGYGEDDAWTIVYRAIARDADAAGEFFEAHLPEIQEMSRSGGPGPILGADGTERKQALADLVRAATVDLRVRNPELAAKNTQRLIQDVDLHKDDGHLDAYPEMQTTYGLIIKEYFSDLAYSATTFVPEGLDAKHLQASKVPPKGLVALGQWNSFLDEALRNGSSAAKIAEAVDSWTAGILLDDEQHIPCADSRDCAGSSELAGRRIATVENLFIVRTRETVRALERDIAKWQERANQVGVAAGWTVDSATDIVSDPELGIPKTVAKSIVWALVEVGTAVPADLKKKIAYLNAVVVDRNWYNSYRAHAEGMWKPDGSNIEPVEAKANFPGTVATQRDGELIYQFTGNPENYAKKGTPGYFWDEKLLRDPGTMSPEQSAAYEQWLQDPALALISMPEVRGRSSMPEVWGQYGLEK